MVNTLKYFAYIICCAVVVLLVSNTINREPTTPQQPANVFEWEKPVNVYFWNDAQGSKDDCDVVFATTRKTPNAETLAPGAIEQLLEGPTAMEKEAGFTTAIPEGVLLQKFEIQNGVAYVDFSKELGKVSGSCRVRGVRAQIEKTLTDLPDIQSVMISIDGKIADVLKP